MCGTNFKEMKSETLNSVFVCDVFRSSWWRRCSIWWHHSEAFRIWRSFSSDLKEESFLCFTAGAPNSLVSLPVSCSIPTWWQQMSERSLLVCDVSSRFRGGSSCPVGLLRSGAEVEAADPAGTCPRCNLRPLHGLPVLLAAPAVHLPPQQTEPGGDAAGDWTPPTLMSLVSSVPESPGACRAGGSCWPRRLTHSGYRPGAESEL